MTLQKLIEELDKLRIEDSSSFNFDKDYINLLTKMENVIISYNKNKAISFCLLIEENLKKKDYSRLQFTIGTLYAIYDFEGEDERKISLKLIEVTESFIKDFHANNVNSFSWVLYTIFDTYFHNPGLITEIAPNEKEKLLEQINKIAEIKYGKDSDFELINYIILDCIIYFKDSEKLKELKIKYETHFDEQVKKVALRKFKRI